MLRKHKWRKEEESVQAPNCRTAIHGVFSADNDDCGLFVCSSATEAFFLYFFFSLLLNCFVSGLDGGKKAEEGQPFSTLGSSHRCCRWRQRHAVVKSGLHRSTHRQSHSLPNWAQISAIFHYMSEPTIYCCLHMAHNSIAGAAPRSTGPAKLPLLLFERLQTWI